MKRLPVIRLMLALFFVLVTAGTALSDTMLTVDFSGTVGSGFINETGSFAPAYTDISGMPFEGYMVLDLSNSTLSDSVINVDNVAVKEDMADQDIMYVLNPSADAFGIQFRENLAVDETASYNVSINFYTGGNYENSFLMSAGDPFSEAYDYWEISAPVVDYTPAPVPEPSTMLLCGLGLVGLLAYRKRFRKA